MEGRMSVSDFDVEPVDQWQGFCSVHGNYYDRDEGCEHCGDDHVNRAIQIRRGRAK